MASRWNAGLRAADWLTLAAAPTLALMGLLSLTSGDGHVALPGSETGQLSLLDGMAPMYLLMAAFHLPPWLKLKDQRQGS